MLSVRNDVNNGDRNKGPSSKCYGTVYSSWPTICQKLSVE